MVFAETGQRVIRCDPVTFQNCEVVRNTGQNQYMDGDVAALCDFLKQACPPRPPGVLPKGHRRGGPSLVRPAYGNQSRSSPFLTCVEPRDQAAVSALRERARQIPLGKKVKVVTVSGEKVEGTLRGAGETSVLIEKRPEPSPATRYDIHGNKMPTPPTAPAIPPTTVEVSYDTMQSIKKPMGTGAKSAIFLGVLFGGLAILGLASADLGNAS